MIHKVNYGMSILLLVIFAISISALYFMKKNVSGKNLYHDTVLAENVLISSEWKEIDVQNLVKIERDKHLIGLMLESPFETPFGKKGIKIPGGEIINPEIKLVDEDKNEYQFVRSGARGTEISNYKYNGTLPANKIYKKILLRSDYPIKVKQVLWTGYDIKDLK